MKIRPIYRYPIFWITDSLMLLIVISQCTLNAIGLELNNRFEFFYVFASIVVSIIFLCIKISYIILFFVFLKRRNRKQIVSAVLIIFSFVLCLFIPFQTIYESCRINKLQTQFDQAARIVEKVPNTEGEIVSLSSNYAHLSREGGEVYVIGEGADKIVEFYLNRGMLFTGSSFYAYVPSKKAYETLLSNGYLIEIKKVRKNWYTCKTR